MIPYISRNHLEKIPAEAYYSYVAKHILVIIYNV